MMPIIMSILVEITDDLIEGLTEEEKDHFLKCLDTMLNNSIKAVEKLRNEKWPLMKLITIWVKIVANTSYKEDKVNE